MFDVARARKMGAAFIARFKTASLFKDVLGAGDGRKVLIEIVRRGGVFQTPMVAGDPHLTAYNAGRQALALEILDLVRWDPERVMQLAEERADLEQEAA